ncbi:MAG: hypothetical protein ACERLM_07625 [Acidimicrobiales bacterium]
MPFVLAVAGGQLTDEGAGGYQRELDTGPAVLYFRGDTGQLSFRRLPLMGRGLARTVTDG